ncbi:MAG: N-acetylmuramoyl-L-alanine amidase [Firmicutes bacterium]|nr:N-acetylmuramoyl-L-alanine amidase [Bacillota bacterium]
MKKLIFKILLPIILIALIILLYFYFKSDKVNINFEEIKADINELYIYGNHLNLKGSLNINQNINTIELVLFDTIEQTYNLNYKNDNNQINFYISDKKNNGIYLDNLDKGNYQVYIKITFENNSNAYYKLKNNTKYSETEYYTIRKDNKFNYILISELEDTLNIEVKSSKKKEIYDVVIDAGHGGIDTGACYKGICETDFTLDLSKKLKEKLEENGLKVKLTRDDSDKKGKKFETYGDNGRIDRAMSSKAKYLFSFHLNSGLSSRTGTEIYTTNNIDYTLAKSIVDNIVISTNTNYSNNPIFKVDKGIYTRTFQKYEISDVIKDAEEEGYDSYNITTNTTYYYIIRETGGIITGAYTDGREDDYNKHYDTNVGLESYILELGYITNPKDTQDIKNNMDNYITAISKAILENICE